MVSAERNSKAIIDFILTRLICALENTMCKVLCVLSLYRNGARRQPCCAGLRKFNQLARTLPARYNSLCLYKAP